MRGSQLFLSDDEHPPYQDASQGSLLLRRKISLVPIKALPALPAPTRELFRAPGQLPLVLEADHPLLPRFRWDCADALVAAPKPSPPRPVIHIIT